uniref:Cytochrome c-553 n=1 Tax=Alexandrium andersonii TaxID=327968 RepID=A0A7S2JAU1_9DINO
MAQAAPRQPIPHPAAPRGALCARAQRREPPKSSAAMARPHLLLLAAALCASASGFAQQGAPRTGLSREASAVGLSFSELAVGDAAAWDRSAEAASSTWRPLALGMALGLMVAVGTFRAPAAVAADLNNGKEIFNNICAACHAAGNNLVVPEKQLKKEALDKYGVVDVTQIKAIIAGGQNAMPSLGNMLDAKEIDDVANYVFEQSKKGWS